MIMRTKDDLDHLVRESNPLLPALETGRAPLHHTPVKVSASGGGNVFQIAFLSHVLILSNIRDQVLSSFLSSFLASFLSSWAGLTSFLSS